MKPFNVEGSWPALVTPFTSDGELNEECLRRLAEFHVDNGSNGIVALGSTSEVTLLSGVERNKIIKVIIDTISGKIPVMAGVSASTTEATIENARYARDTGVDCGLLVQPAYIKPSQEALYKNFKDVAMEADLPLVIYNNPERAGVNIAY